MVQSGEKRKCPDVGSSFGGKAKALSKELANQNRKALANKTKPLEKSDANLEQEADELDGFKASEGWLSGFKQKHSIVFKATQGEAADIDMTALADWQVDVLHNEISRFSANDVFNADETGLFWQLLPNKTLSFKGERCTSGKKSKQRITVLVCANMSGTEKLPLLVIGKSAKPRAFKNKELPVSYKWNKKAWMTADIFETWLKQWDSKLLREGRKVLLYLDNFSGHSKINLEQITLKFFPPNTTAASQPCDQGIIQNLKVHYRGQLLRECITAIDDTTEYKVDLYRALRFLHRSWSNVKPETIANCFRKAKFIKDLEQGAGSRENQENAVIELEQEGAGGELSTLWEEMQAVSLVEGALDDYLLVDHQLATGGAFTLAEIAADVLTEVEEPESESETELMEIDQVLEPPVNTREAIEALKILQRYADENAIVAVQLLCDKVDDVLAEERMKKLKQKSISSYFLPIP